MSEQEQVFYTVDEVAKILRVSRGTVIAMLERGEIKARKVGRQWRILKSDLDQYTQSS